MSCGLIDLTCHVNTFLAGIWWLPYAIWGVLGLLILVALAKVKEFAGWPGVFAVLTLGAYGFGYWRGKRDEPLNPIEHIDPNSPDAQPSFRGPKHSTRPPKNSVHDEAYDKWKRGEQP